MWPGVPGRSREAVESRQERWGGPGSLCIVAVARDPRNMESWSREVPTQLVAKKLAQLSSHLRLALNTPNRIRSPTFCICRRDAASKSSVCGFDPEAMAVAVAGELLPDEFAPILSTSPPALSSSTRSWMGG